MLLLLFEMQQFPAVVAENAGKNPNMHVLSLTNVGGKGLREVATLTYHNRTWPTPSQKVQNNMIHRR